MKCKNQQGFSLVELMTTVAITILVLAGVVTTFSKIASSSTNTSKSAALTNTTRGLTHMIGYDFASAGRGFSDLIPINIRYQFSESFYTYGETEERDTYLYSISDLNYDEDTQTSEITLNYFDYDMRNNPSFFVEVPEDEAEDWGQETHKTYNSLILSTKDNAALAKLESGDILLIYPIHPFVELSSETRTPWSSFEGKNEAFILQVSEVGEISDQGENRLALTVTFGEGPVFSNTFDKPPANSSAIEPSTDVYTSIKDRTNSGYALPSQAWIARKLGDVDSFNRVTYQVVSGEEGGGTLALARRRNDTNELLATNVQTFTVRLGLDINPSFAADMENMPRSEMNGQVSRLDTDFWTMGKGYDSVWDSISVDEYLIAIGRHTLQAEVEFMQQGATDTTEKAGEDGAYQQRRGFTQQYRIRNVTAPVRTGDSE